MSMFAKFDYPETMSEEKVIETTFSALLSSVVYEDQLKCFNKMLDEDTTHLNLVDKKKVNDLKNSYANYITVLNNIEPICPIAFKMQNKGVVNEVGLPYSFEEGVVKVGEPGKEKAALGLGVSDLNGKKTFHISFRGTEPNLGLLGILKNYVVGDYQNMDRHYKCFKPFLEKALETAKAYGCEEIHVAGHSLGGAMVQKFLSEHPNDNRIKGFAFGNPCSNHVLKRTIGLVDKFKEICEMRKVEGKLKFSNFLSLGMKKFAVSSSNFAVRLTHAFLVASVNSVGVGANFFINQFDALLTQTKLQELLREKVIGYDKRLTVVNHGNDPVPMAGVLLYKQEGNIYLLRDKNEGLPIARNHSVFNYVNSLFELAKKKGMNLKDNKYLADAAEAYEAIDKKINELKTNPNANPKVNIEGKRLKIINTLDLSRSPSAC